MVVRSETEQRIIVREDLPEDISGGEIIKRHATPEEIQQIGRERRSAEFQERLQAERQFRSERERLGARLRLSREEIEELTPQDVAEISFKRSFRSREGRPPTETEVMQELERRGLVERPTPEPELGVVEEPMVEPEVTTTTTRTTREPPPQIVEGRTTTTRTKIPQRTRREELLELPIEERRRVVARERIEELKESELLGERVFGEFLTRLPESVQAEQPGLAAPETIGGPTPVTEEEFLKFVEVTERQRRGLELVELIEGTAMLGGVAVGVAGRARRRTEAFERVVEQPSLEQFRTRTRTEEFVEPGRGLRFERDITETTMAPTVARRVPVRERPQRELDLPKNFMDVVERRIISGKELKGTTIAPLSLERIVALSRQKEPRLEDFPERVRKDEPLFFIIEGRGARPIRQPKEERVEDIKLDVGRGVQVTRTRARETVEATEKVRLTTRVIEPRSALRAIQEPGLDIDVDIRERPAERIGRRRRVRLEERPRVDVAERLEDVTGVGVTPAQRQPPRDITTQVPDVTVEPTPRKPPTEPTFDIDIPDITVETPKEKVPTGGLPVLRERLTQEEKKAKKKRQRGFRETVNIELGDIKL